MCSKWKSLKKPNALWLQDKNFKARNFKKQILPHDLISFFSVYFQSVVLAPKRTLGADGSPRMAGRGKPGEAHFWSQDKSKFRIGSAYSSQWLYRQLRYKKFELHTHSHTQRRALLFQQLTEPGSREGNGSGWWPEVSTVRLPGFEGFHRVSQGLREMPREKSEASVYVSLLLLL